MRVCTTISLAIILTAAGLGAPASAQQEPREIDQWDTSHGLPQNTVNAIAETRDGYLWLGTNGGLARFDGVRFTVFQPSTCPGLNGTRILSLFTDSRGDLWIGTQFGGVSRFRGGAFEAISFVDDAVPGAIHAIAEHRDGSIQAGSWRYDGSRFVRLPDVTGYIRSIVLDRDGVLWLGSDAGIFEVRAGRITRRPVHDCLLVALDAAGTVWASRGSTPLRLTGSDVLPWAEGSQQLEAAIRTSDGDLIVGGRDGLFSIPGEMGSPRDPAQKLPLAQVPGTARIGWVRTLYTDRYGDLWCGSNVRGVFRLRRPIAREVPREGQPAKDLVASDRRGGVWLGTTRSRFFKHIAPDGDVTKRHTGGYYVFGMMVAKEGGLWVRAGRELCLFAPECRQRIPLPIRIPFQYGPMAEDAGGRIWLGLGPYLARKDGDEVRLLDGFEVRQKVASIACARDGTVWVGCHSRLARLRDGAFRYFDVADGLPPGKVRDIHEASDGTLWLASYGGGLVRVDGDRFSVFSAADGLPDVHLSEILEDDAGNLWIHSNLGLSRVALRDLAAHRPGQRGLPIAHATTGEANGSTGALLPDGRAYLPTIYGVRVVDTTRVVSQAPKRTFITGFDAGTTAIDRSKTIEIPPHRRRLTFHFTSPVLRDPDRVHFFYRLSGRHEDWLPASEDRRAFYENVPPGDYRFEVYAENDAGAAEPAAIAFTVVPRLYETLLFRLALVLALLGLVAGVFHLRAAASRRRQEALGAEIDRRARVEEALEVQLAFDHLATDVAARLAQTTSAEIDTTIDWALESLGRLLRAERAFLARFPEDEDGHDVRFTNTWTRSPESDAALRAMSGAPEFAYALGVLRSGEMINVGPGLAGFPEEAADLRRLLERSGATSGVVLPVGVEGRVFGFFGVDTVDEPMRYSPTWVDRLPIVADMFGSTLQRVEAERALLDGMARFVSAQEEERRRIAREIHDGPSQQLASLSMDLSVLRTRLATDASTDDIADLARRARRIATDVHGMARLLHSTVVQDLGLRRALESEVEILERQSAARVELDVEGGDRGQLPDAVATALFRIVQEGLRNAQRHAGAHTIHVRLAKEDGQFVLAIEDDGVGFDPKQAERLGGLGLSSMRERAVLLAGSMTLRTTPGEGTTIEVRIPVEDPPV